MTGISINPERVKKNLRSAYGRRVLLERLIQEKEKEMLEDILRPGKFESIIAINILFNELSSIIGKPFAEPMLEFLKKFRFRVPGLRERRVGRPPRNRAEAIVAVLLRDREKMTPNDVARAMGFSFTQDSYGNKSFSKTCKRHIDDGRKTMRKLALYGFTFEFKDGLPKLCWHRVPLKESEFPEVWIERVGEPFENEVRELYANAIKRGGEKK